MAQEAHWLPFAQAMLAHDIIERGVRDPEVLRAMTAIPRHLFVPDVSLPTAYSDWALSIADGQTISQPYMVALMTELLQVQAGMSVLEIGTGSGYQTAILACLTTRVFSIERSPVLAKQARSRLEEMGLRNNITLHVGDGSLGWPEGGMFDRILVTAGAPSLPPAYAAQLAPQGRLVIPLGPRDQQTLTVFVKQHDRLVKKPSIPCRFVPLVGTEGWKE